MEVNWDEIAPKIWDLHVIFLYVVLYLQMYLEGDRYHLDMFACFQCKNAGHPRRSHPILFCKQIQAFCGEQKIAKK